MAEYKFNGKNLNQRKLALEVIKYFINDKFDQNIDYFRKQLNGRNFSSPKIIIDEEEKNEFILNKGKEEFKTRYFSENSERVFINQKPYYITNQWGSDTKGKGRYFDGFLNFARNELKYDIQEVNPHYDKESELKQEKESRNMPKEENIKIELKIKNIMLYGAPGVGKTHNYKRLITMIENGIDEKTIFDTISENTNTDNFDSSVFENIKKENRLEFVTFHQSYSYEDFIEGFRPNENGNINLENGIFKKLCEKARENLEKNFYIVIDEINRGNISKIFGELITLIEEDKRDIYEVTLPYSKEKFKIPSNLYIIATMNSTDKSIATIDIALRRRFTFLKMKPNIDLVPNEAKELFSKLNEFITNNLGEDYQLGHSYFMQGLDLEFVKEYKIKPLLEEYFYGDEENYKKALEIL
ncbi:hypothetical protein CRU92_06685 [Arcobacter sp. FW59]|nr:hypothetical protein CRU92_06685 [Arcobacter sp. FW59]